MENFQAHRHNFSDYSHDFILSAMSPKLALTTFRVV